jgi:hypothetical protein
MDLQRGFGCFRLPNLSSSALAVDNEGRSTRGAGCTADPFKIEVVTNNISPKITQYEVKHRLREDSCAERLYLTVERSIVKTVNDTVCDTEIQFRIVKPRR